MSAHIGIEAANRPELKELEQNIAPEKVLDRIESHSHAA
jgi:hypothetical protein